MGIDAAGSTDEAGSLAEEDTPELEPTRELEAEPELLGTMLELPAVTAAADDALLNVLVTGQMVVEMEMSSVVTEPSRAGQSVTVGAQEVIV